MSDSRRPNPPAPSFEVPDLELEPVPRSLPPTAPMAGLPSASSPAKARPSAPDQSFGASFDFGDEGELGNFELERTAQPNFAQAAATRGVSTAASAPSWPTGRALEAVELALDPRELAILADYGDPPDSVPATLAYAYRVFTRQRELKRQLVPIAAECERAQFEREATLAELSRAMRPALESIAQFRRFLAPLAEIEQRAAARGQALTSINAQLDAQSTELDTELARIKDRIATEQRLEGEAQREYDAREANAKRAEAKLKRVQIEVRAVLHIAEQKLGAAGGQMHDPEAGQLATLQQRAESLEPEVAHTRAELEQAQQAQSQVHARLDALGQSERQIARMKQGLGAAYQKELSARTQGVSESEVEQRAALANLARGMLAAPGAVDIPADWLERVRRVCDHADKLTVRTEMQRRAVAAYDAPRARQGVRLACTAVGLLLVLFAFKLIF